MAHFRSVALAGRFDGPAVLDRFREALFDTAVSYASVRGLAILMDAAQGGHPNLDYVSDGVLEELERNQLIAHSGDRIVVL